MATWCIDAAAQQSAPPQLVRLQLGWSGSDESRPAWRGRLRIDGGRFVDLKVLEPPAAAAADFSIDEGEILIHPAVPRGRQRIEISAFAVESGRISVELSDGIGSQPFVTEFLLSQVTRQPVTRAINGAGGEFSAVRSPSDGLRIEIDRENLLFVPGEPFAFQVRPMLPELQPGSTFDLSVSIGSTINGKALWSDQQRLPVPIDGTPTAQVSIPLPSEEGVYRVFVSIGRPPGLTDRFFPVGAKQEALASRDFEIAVVEGAADYSATVGEWEPVLSIDPANPRWWQRLPKWTQVGRLPGLMPGPLGSVRAATVETAQGTFVELPASEPETEPHWQAYPLPLESVGVPHLLEIDYPADQEQHFSLSVLDPNELGSIASIGKSSGIYIEGLGLSENLEKQMHQVVFWPQSNSPLLLVTNLSPESNARFGTIRVMRRKGPLATRGASWQHAERLVAAYLAGPESFKVSDASESSEQNVGDRRGTLRGTFQGAQRLTEYLPYAGYNAVVLGDIFDDPQATLRPIVTPASADSILPLSEDLPTTDPLELYLKVFDRSGLGVVPTLPTASSIPELEILRRSSDPQSSGIEPVGRDGRTWSEVHGRRGYGGPLYNLLDDRVQIEILRVARQWLERYGHHPSLAGLGIQLSGSGYAQLPGAGWGLDDATWADFERETGVVVAGQGADRFANRYAAALGEHTDLWKAWRARKLTRFYEQLARLVTSTGGNRKLLLSTEAMFSTPELARLVRPNLQVNLKLDRAALSAGIDRGALARLPGIQLTTTKFVSPTTPLADHATHLIQNEAGAAEQRRNSDSSITALFYHPTKAVMMSGFGAKSGYREHAVLQVSSSPGLGTSRRPYARSLARGDLAWVIEGGEFLPVGQEGATRQLRKLLQQLPIGNASAVVESQPVTVRQYVVGARNMAVVVNNSPWSVAAEVSLAVGQATECRTVADQSVAEGGTPPASQILEAGTQRMTLQLAPYEIRGLEFSTPAVRADGVQINLSSTATAELASRLQTLAGRDLTAVSSYDQLTNPGFEAIGDGTPVPGWELVNAPSGTTIELDATQPRGGKTSLYWRSSGGTSTVRSSLFRAPPTGQLFLYAFVRGREMSPGTKLRMILEGEGEDGPYRQFVTLGGDTTGTNHFAHEWGRPFGFWVNDLPLGTQAQLRLKFELTGAGELWIDEIKLQDLLFPLEYYDYFKEERLELVKLKKAASDALDDGRTSDSIELLECYWPRFLQEYTQATPPPLLVQPPAPASKQPAESQKSDDESSTVGGLRKYLFWSR